MASGYGFLSLTQFRSGRALDAALDDYLLDSLLAPALGSVMVGGWDGTKDLLLVPVWEGL